MDLKGKIVNYKYKIDALIAESEFASIYTAYNRLDDNNNVIIKFIKPDGINKRRDEIIRFYNETIAVSNINHPSIIKIYEVGAVDDLHFVVMEPCNGVPLSEILHKNITLSVDQIVTIISLIADALAAIHHHDILHNGLNPGNIIVLDVRDFTALKLKNFGFAHIRDYSCIREPAAVIETFSYMSPEQSGIITRTVDARSDIYSLGIIFYQLLSKKLPFTGADVSAILHQHIAMLPESLTEIDSNIPAFLEQMVFKSLEKEPDRRYPAIGAFIDDLKRYRSGGLYILPRSDEQTSQLGPVIDLIGRETEYDRLIKIFDAAMKGNGMLCLISGESGIGKTRLVDEMINNIYYHKGTFIEGNSLAGGNKLPYGAIRDAIQAYLKNYTDYPEQKKETISARLRESLGHLGEILIRLNPALQTMLGPQPSLVRLRPDRETKRFFLTVVRFFYQLSVIEEGIVLILDNLQWLDDSSFYLLMEMMKHIAGYPLLIIGLYRDNEIYESHTLLKLLNHINANNYPMEEIALAGLPPEMINRCIAQMLYSPVEHTKALTEYVYDLGGGNPYLSIEIVKQLIAEKGIIKKANGWDIRHDVLEHLTISHTLIDVILKKISYLNEKEKTVLSYAAVMGNQFDIEPLFMLTKYSDEEVTDIIDRAIALQFIQKKPRDTEKLFFTDGRIKEAFYQSLDPDKRRLLHETIARAIETIQPANQDQLLFDLAYHYIESGKKDKILEYALPAGIRAQENHANDESVRYLSLVRTILENEGKAGSDQWILCMETIGRVYLTIGKYDDSIIIFNQLLPFLKTSTEQAEVYRFLSQAFFSKGDLQACEQYGKDGLLLLGEKLPLRTPAVVFGLILEIMIYNLHAAVSPLFREKKNEKKRNLYKAIIQFYMILNWMYILSDVRKFVRSVLRMLNSSRANIGKSKELGMSLAVYASLLMVIPLFKKAVKYHELALTMRQELGDQFGEAQSYQFMGYCFCFQGEYRLSIDYFNRANAIFTNIGDVWEIAMVMNGLGYNYLYLGDYDAMINSFAQYLDISEKINDYYGICVASTNLGLAYAQRGEFDAAKTYGMRALTLSEEKKLWYPHCFANVNYGYLMMERGNIEDGLGYFERAHALYQKHEFLKDYTINLFSFLAEAYIELYKMGVSRITLPMVRNMCRESRKQSRRWQNHYAAAVRASAKYHALTNNNRKAEQLFKKSIRHSATLGRMYEVAKGLYEFGLFLKRTGRDDYADARLRTAYQIFTEMRSTVYVKRIENLLALKPEQDLSSMRMMIDKQRMFSIIQVSQDISSIMNLHDLLEKIMAVSIEVTGAHRGYLLISNEETKALEIVAQKNLKNGHPDKFDLMMRFIMAIGTEVYRSGISLITANAMEDERFAKYPVVAKYGLKSILSIPLKYKDEIKGVCYLDNPLSSSVFTNEDRDVLSIIMTQAAISIEIVRLYELGITDGLTKLVTHRHFQNLLQKEINNAVRYKRDLSLLMIDIDHFKTFNDTYGHQSGDEVLRSVSRIIQNTCRNIDTPARYGGEEIAVILPETSTEKAAMVAERIRSQIALNIVDYRGHALSVTVSLGVATFPAHASDRETLIKAADDALYHSKANGRDMVSIAQAQLSS